MTDSVYPPGMESSFLVHLRSTQPELLIEHGSLPAESQPASATTIVALRFDGGVIMAGDRRATVGHRIASEHMHKVFPADAHSLVGISGATGLAVDMARLFAVELEHYEKIEGTELSLMGKANRLGWLVKEHLPQAMHGLVALPLFAGVDPHTEAAKIFSFDVTGGRFEELNHHSIGSGSPYAGSTLKRLWRDELNEVQAQRIAVEALIDASEQDSATSGAHVHRGIYPVVYQCTAAGVEQLTEHTVAGFVQERLGGASA